jgi:hypothetical protein
MWNREALECRKFTQKRKLDITRCHHSHQDGNSFLEGLFPSLHPLPSTVGYSASIPCLRLVPLRHYAITSVEPFVEPVASSRGILPCSLPIFILGP